MPIMKKILAIAVTISALLTHSLSQAEQLTVAIAGTNEDLNVLRNNVASFHQVSEHRVDIVALPVANYDGFTEFSKWLQAGVSEIDVYVFDFYQALVLREHLLELNYPSAKAHWPIVMQAHQAEGKIYALPYNLDVQVMFYRRDWVPFPPATWEQLVDVGGDVLRRELGLGSRDLEVYAFAADSAADLAANAMEWSASYSGGGFGIASGSIRAHNIDNIRALTYIQSLFGSTIPEYNLEIAFSSMRERMADGGLIFIRDWYSQGKYYQQNLPRSSVNVRLDWAPLPGGGNGSAASIRGQSLAVSKYSTKPVIAAQFISFLSGSNNQQNNTIRYGTLPTWSALYTGAELALAVPRAAELAKILENNAVSLPAEQLGAEYFAAVESIAAATENILNKKASAQGALSGLEVELNKILTSDASSQD